MKLLAILATILASLAACGDDGGAPCAIDATNLCTKLSSYTALFADVASQTPADGTVPFTVATPLFADYTTKQRFLYLPPGSAMTWHDTTAFDLPSGSVLVKTFGYLHDRRDPSSGERLLETRLLIKGDAGWSGAAYVYNDDQKDATLQVAGDVIDASWIHDDGATRTNGYIVPNKNQCRSCHGETDENTITPLGPKARHLNQGGQLEALVAGGQLVGAPDPTAWPREADASSTLDARARTWLDVTCAHCHNPTGMARTSGLFLDYAETAPAVFGICKAPVATGRGSGGRAYDIVPGMPDASIMTYRIEATEPEIKMPELGRNLVDDAGVALIRQWITEMTGTCSG